MQTQMIINKTECPNSISWKFGATSVDVVKIYFENEEDLTKKLQSIKRVINKELGFIQ